MSTIDIRSTKGEQVTRILFAEGEHDTTAVSLEIDRVDVPKGKVGIVALFGEDYAPLILDTKKDAENMIAALNKAIELDWLA